jgi:hypothetical protein
MEATTTSRIVSRRRLVAGGAAVAAGTAALAVPSFASAAGPSLNRLADESDIRQLTVNYALATDALGRGEHDFGLALYEATFTADAPIQAGTSPTLIGPEAWAEFVETALTPFSATQHLLGTINVILGSGNNPSAATMTTYLHATHEFAPGGNILVVLGTYFDDVVRLKEGWRISKRTLVFTSVELRTHP